MGTVILIGLRNLRQGGRRTVLLGLALALVTLLLVLLAQPRRLLALPPIGSKMGVVCPLRVPRGNCGLIVAGNAKRYTARKPPQDCHRGPWRNLEGCRGGSGRS